MNKQSEMNMQNEKKRENENTSSAVEKKQPPKQPQKVDRNKLLVFRAQKQFEASNEFQMNFNREASFATQILNSNDFFRIAYVCFVSHHFPENGAVYRLFFDFNYKAYRLSFIKLIFAGGFLPGHVWRPFLYTNTH